MQKQIQNEAIMASAGCGKTEELAMRFLRLLAVEPHADTIMALTFTKAAAGEMMQRILLFLAKAILDENKFNELVSRLNLDLPLDKSQIEAWLKRMVDDMPRLKISTIDSFFAELSRCFAWDLGVDAEAELIDTYMLNQLRMNALSILFDNLRTNKKEFDRFNKIFEEIVGTQSQRIIGATLLKSINDFYDIYLASNAAAWKYFLNYPAPLNDDLWDTLLQELFDRPNYDSSNTNLTKYKVKLENKDWSEILKAGPVLKYIDQSNKYGKWIYDDQDCELFKKIATNAALHLLKPAAVTTFGYFQFLDLFDINLRKLKEKGGYQNFDDITRAISGLGKNGLNIDLANIFFRLDGRINHLLLDEFQDTSRIQWQAIEPIADEIIQDPSGQRTFFAVGDIKQAIYSWRGGDARLFGEIINHYKDGLVERSMEKSYRSGNNILEIVNKIFGTSTTTEQDFYLNMWQQISKFKNHTSAVTEKSPGYFELIKVAATGSTADLFEIRMQAVIAQLKIIKPWERDLKCCLLFRKGANVNTAIDMLRTENINCYSAGKSTLTKDAAVQALLSLFQLLSDRDDKIAREHLASSFIGKKIPKNNDKLNAFLANLKHDLIYTSYAAVIKKLVLDLQSMLSQATQQRLEQLIVLAEQYQAYRTSNPADFVQFVNDAAPKEIMVSDGVVCSTMHAAKGMTYDLVFLPFIESAINNKSVYYCCKNPIADSFESQSNSQIKAVIKNPTKNIVAALSELSEIKEQSQNEAWLEHYNLMYVAMTRASKGLYIYYSKAVKNTFAELLEEKLLSQDLNLINETIQSVCSKGAQNWYEKFVSKSSLKTVSKVRQKIKLKATTNRRRPYITPSTVKEQKDFRALAFSEKNRQAKKRGTFIHLLLSNIIWLDDGIDNIESCALSILSELKLNQDLGDKFMAEYFQIIAQTNIKNLLTNSAEECQVDCEENFVSILGNNLVSGQFDRVVYYPNKQKPVKIEIYDYKTDRIKNNIDQKKETYNEQISIYVQILQKKYKAYQPEVTGYIVFTEVDEIIKMA